MVAPLLIVSLCKKAKESGNSDFGFVNSKLPQLFEFCCSNKMFVEMWALPIWDHGAPNVEEAATSWVLSNV